MAAQQSVHPEVALNLALALIASSKAPVLLLDGDLSVIAASASFCRAFDIDPAAVSGRKLSAFGAGEWKAAQLGVLLKSTASGHADIQAYEMDLLRAGKETRHLVLHAHKLDYADEAQVRLLLSVTDITEARIAEKLKDDLVRDKELLLQELQHRVANSLQIIASVLLQSARRVQSDETRSHLHAAHHRVMSVAALQKQLSKAHSDDVALQSYFKELCESLGASMIRDHNQLSLAVTTDESTASADVSISLGLIITELVINALKHAFPRDQVGKISVDYQSHGADWTLSVGDDGVGFPRNGVEAKPGLGTSIVRALARQLDAQVVVTDNDPGTGISIIHKQAAKPVAALAV
jgi:two-component system, sensor histidine kinase PdtaS